MLSDIAFCSAFVLAALLAVVSADSSHPQHHVTGLAGSSVTIPCFHGSDPPPSPVSVQWMDRVYATSQEPIVIFSSSSNPTRNVDADHPNKYNYRIDSNFRLQILNLVVDNDVGEYICRAVLQTGAEDERHYHLSIAGKSKCEGPTPARVQPGTLVNLQCQMQFGSVTGTPPTMAWMADKEPIDSIDQFDVGMAQRSLQFTATPDDDQKPYRCVTSLGDVADECRIVLSVPHSVRDIKFTPSKNVLHVGDELRCSARGNPVPQISLTPSLEGKEAAGVGWKSFRVPADWENTGSRTVNCVAVNDVDGKSATVSASVTFNVTAAKNTGGNGASSMIRSELFGSLLIFFASLLTALTLLH